MKLEVLLEVLDALRMGEFVTCSNSQSIGECRAQCFIATVALRQALKSEGIEIPVTTEAVTA